MLHARELADQIDLTNGAKPRVFNPDGVFGIDRLLTKLRQSLAAGLVQEARVRASRFVFGPYSPWPVAFRVSGPDLARVRAIADQVLARMRTDPHTRQANGDPGERAPTIHFVLDQDRLHLMGLTPSEAGEQIQFLLTGVPGHPSSGGHPRS
jgi:multidrug efflux pump subunit AcrB